MGSAVNISIHEAMRRRQSGVTLIEMMVVVAILLLLTGAAVVSFLAVGVQTHRKNAARVAGAIRYAYDRAQATGKDHRLVFELNDSETRIHLEVADEGSVLTGADADKSIKIQEEEEEAEKEGADNGTTTKGGLDKDLEIKKPPLPKWKPYKSRLSKPILLKENRVESIYLSRLDQEVNDGKVYLYFWGNGQTERAILYIVDKKAKTYSLVVHPLTGKVKLIRDKYTFIRGEAHQDDEGQEVGQR